MPRETPEHRVLIDLAMPRLPVASAAAPGAISRQDDAVAWDFVLPTRDTREVERRARPAELGGAPRGPASQDGARPAMPGGSGGAATDVEPCFDRERAIARLGGDAELFHLTVESFLEEAPAILHQLRGALEGDDAETLERVAHSTKGVAAMLDASAFAVEALRLEILGRDRDVAGASEALADFERELRRLVSALEAVRS